MGKYRKVCYRIGSDEEDRSGVLAEYTYMDRRVSLFGWYDSFVGIMPVDMTLGEFLRGLHITLEDCRQALEERAE